jgi:NarL family two-component system sensor histidine kinase LiaS
VPILEESDGTVLGALAFTTEALPWSLWSLDVIAQQIGYSLLFFTLFAGLMGTLFGSLTARGLVRRLGRLSESTNAWSRGDFSVFVDDSTGDELGHLAHDLNRMAQQLESLLNKRQEISVMEERNRLARDLHDSAKQQAFAASAQLGAAQALWHQDPTEAEGHLDEAAALVDEVRQELTHLIQELRPVALQGTGLASALREYGRDWAHQNCIQIEVRVQGERPLSLDVELSLFRIAQEALANVARHSQADKTEISLSYGADVITLAVSDDGCGFDVGKTEGGLGLRSMLERAELLRGELVVSSALGKGTEVMVTCPTAI